MSVLSHICIGFRRQTTVPLINSNLLNWCSFPELQNLWSTRDKTPHIPWSQRRAYPFLLFTWAFLLDQKIGSFSWGRDYMHMRTGAAENQHLVNVFPPNQSPESYLYSPCLKLRGNKKASMRHTTSKTKLFHSPLKIEKKISSIVSILL